MSTLSEFLLARIAEDEERARRVGSVEHPLSQADYWRVLYECDAKQRIVKQYEDYRGTVMAYRSPRWREDMNKQDKQNWHNAEARHRVAEDFVRLLALPYADHPDYLEEWKP